MISIEELEWIGAIAGAVGALLLAFNNHWSRYGFVLFLVSNVAWMAYGWKTNASAMITMQVVYTSTSLIGVWRWLILPILNRPKKRRDLAMLPVQQIISPTAIEACGNGEHYGR